MKNFVITIYKYTKYPGFIIINTVGINQNKLLRESFFCLFNINSKL